MADGTLIQLVRRYGGRPSPVCSRKSPAGCTNCYAQRLAGTPDETPLARVRGSPATRCTASMSEHRGGAVQRAVAWNSRIRWKKPRRIHRPVAHGDLFHENVPDEWIDWIFVVMALTPHHVYQTT